MPRVFVYKSNDLRELAVQNYRIDTTNFVFHTFFAKVKTPPPIVNLNTDGLDDYCWERAEVLLRNYDLLPNVAPVLEILRHNNP